MPPQDQAPAKDADLEHMPMNLKEGDRYVVNHVEGLTTVDFGGHVRLGLEETTMLSIMVKGSTSTKDEQKRRLRRGQCRAVGKQWQQGRVGRGWVATGRGCIAAKQRLQGRWVEVEEGNVRWPVGRDRAAIGQRG
ncbi:hypothetical protein BHM03_00032943 [Ensete ventricosum]|uniref:Uncharacterized protein n=1 Tax=Ensete ventricosum TaxID=4639 RepID=A0A445MIQ9_ENSVE|nr:hypothetical protein BHM03_00032943 [Ensete ventricosum]